MAVMGSLVFIHPNDMSRMIKSDKTIIDMVNYEWLDGYEIKQINGILYRETLKVPEVIEDIEEIAQ